MGAGAELRKRRHHARVAHLTSELALLAQGLAAANAEQFASLRRRFDWLRAVLLALFTPSALR